jgi:hypothetical protein
MPESSQTYELLWQIIPTLISLGFIAGMFKAYSLRNEKMADILVVSSIWFFVLLGLVGTLTSDILTTTQKIRAIFFTPNLYINLFLFGGVLAKTYFSKYYGNIILKIGIVILFLTSYVFYPVASIYVANQLGKPIFVFLHIYFFLGAIQTILFYVPYFKLISNTNINVSITSKNDPKDW